MHYTCKRQPPCRGYLNTGTSEWQRLKLKLHRKCHQKQQKYLPTVFTSVSVQLPPLFSHTSHFNLQRDPNSTHKHKCGAWCALRANWRNASSEQYLRCMRNNVDYLSRTCSFESDTTLRFENTPWIPLQWLRLLRDWRIRWLATSCPGRMHV